MSITQHFQIYTNLSVYEKMTKEFNDFQKLINNIKILFENQLKRQETFLGELGIHTALFSSNLNPKASNRDIECKLKRLPEVQNELTNQLKALILVQNKELIIFSKESFSQVTQLNNFLSEYIFNNVKAYKQDESVFKETDIKYKQTVAEFNHIVERYRKSPGDTSQILNSGERAIRNQQIQTMIKSIREMEQQLRISMQLINTRRKTLCVDLIELRKIAEDCFSSVKAKLHKMLKKFLQSCSGQLQILLLQIQRDQKNDQTARNYATVIPDWTRFNFTSEYEPTPFILTPIGSSRAVSRPELIPNEISSVTENMAEDWSTVREEFEELHSFYSIRETAQDLEPNEMFPNIDKFPQFLAFPKKIDPQNLFHYPEWIMAYCKQIQDNCQARIGQIKLFHNFLDMFVRISKTLKCTIPLESQHSLSSNIQSLPWFGVLKAFLGDQSCSLMEQMTQQQDGQVFIFQSLSRFLLIKIELLARLGVELSKNQAIIFSGINHQIQELNKQKLQFLKAEGLLVKNRTLSLQSINQYFKKYDEQTVSEIQYRQLIELTSKTIMHQLTELREQDFKAIKCMSEIVDSFQREICSQIKSFLDVVYNLQNYSFDGNFHSQLRQNSSKQLQQHHLFKCLYIRSPTQPSQLLLEHGVSAELDTFFHRDMAYDLMMKMFSSKEQPEILVTIEEDQGAEASQINERAMKIQSLIDQEPKVFVGEHIFSIHNISVRKFFKAIFSDDQVGAFPNMISKIKKDALGCQNFRLQQFRYCSCTKWVPDPPVEFDHEQGMESFVKYEPIMSCRWINCISPLPKSSIPFMPKSCECKEEQKIYFVSLDRIVIDMNVQTFKAPYSDSFYCRVRYDVKNHKNDAIKFIIRVEMVFVKSTIVRKVIEAASIQEMASSTKKLLASIQNELESFLRKPSQQLEQQKATLQQLDDQTPSFDGNDVVKPSKRRLSGVFRSLWIIIISIIVILAASVLFNGNIIDA